MRASEDIRNRYDITEFIKDDSGHPGGADIPMEYAGKDATEFWTDMQYEAACHPTVELTAGPARN